ncbi:MAG: hypothetical protein IKA30_04015 [Alphaproteobacteria bacterium]|nr:hypothetical protein [Alphaproteobacteria bacterium]
MMDNKPNRKTHTSSVVKRKYNDKTYETVRAMLPIDLVQQFKAKCEREGKSQASIIKAAIEAYLQS